MDNNIDGSFFFLGGNFGIQIGHELFVYHCLPVHPKLYTAHVSLSKNHENPHFTWAHPWLHPSGCVIILARHIDDEQLSAPICPQCCTVFQGDEFLFFGWFYLIFWVVKPVRFAGSIRILGHFRVVLQFSCCVC